MGTRKMPRAVDLALNHSGAAKKKLQEKVPRANTGMAAGAGAVGVAAARGGSNALVAANGVMGGHAMKAMVDTVGARNAGMVLARTGGASSATVVLPIGLLGDQFACDVKKYWKGDIDGAQLAESTTKNIASMGVGCVGGYGGAVVGAEVGLVGGPVGAMVGGIVGAVVGGVTGAIIGENVASSALGLEQGASNSDVRSRYLRLSRDNHPDKGGNKKEFVKINTAYEIIRASQNMKNAR